MIYIRLSTVEHPNHILKDDRWGVAMANRIQTDPAMEIKYGSFIVWSSLKRI